MGTRSTHGGLGALRDLIGLSPTEPTSSTWSAHRATGSDELLLGLVGQAESPRFLLPLAHRSATVAALLTYNRLRDPRTRLSRTAVAGALRIGASSRIISQTYVADQGPGSLIAHLAEVVGTPDLSVAIGIGNFDAVWKPTLQCFSPDGTPVAYAKVGVGPVAAPLVSNEAETLRLWGAADDPRLVTPTLLARTVWRDHPVAVTAPMPSDVARMPVGEVSAWPVRDLDPSATTAPLDGATWWNDRVAAHGDHPVVGRLLDTVSRQHGSESHQWARWHGDWVPWNMARSSRGLVVWDWEYSEPGAPVGLDEAHSRYQVSRVQRRRSVARALDDVRVVATHPWLADAHLIALVTRHLDLENLAGGPVGDHDEVMAAATLRCHDRS